MVKCNEIFANLLSFLVDVDDDTSTSVVTTQLIKPRKQALYIVRQVNSYQQLPVINLIPVTHFAESEFKTGKEQKGMLALHRLLMKVTPGADVAAAATVSAPAVAALPPAAGTAGTTVAPAAAFTEAQLVLLAELFSVTSDGLKVVTANAA